MSTGTAPSEHQPRPDPGDVRAEPDRLRVENAFLRAQRDVLLRVATGCAEDRHDLR